MKISLVLLLLTLLSCLTACSKTEQQSPTLSNSLNFQGKNYSYEGTREVADNGYIITEYKQLYSRIYFVAPTKDIQDTNMYLFSERYKKSFEDMGFEVYSLGEEHIGYDDHSIIYIVSSNNSKNLVVLLAVKTEEYEEKHEQAKAFLDALKELSPKTESKA